MSDDGFLSKPKKVCECKEGTSSDGKTCFGSCAVQGWRRNMEDNHAALSDDKIYAVFDGHGGWLISSYAAARLPLLLREHLQNRGGEKLAEATKAAYVALNDELKPGARGREECQEMAGVRFTKRTMEDVFDYSGTTVAAVSLHAGNLLCASNVGDSSCVLCRNGKAVRLSSKHRPTNADERERVTREGGDFTLSHIPAMLKSDDGMMWLTVTRAIGDLGYSALSCVPHVHVEELRPGEDEFVVLCSDGLTDVRTDQEIVDAVAAKLKGSQTPVDAAVRLAYDAIPDVPPEHWTGWPFPGSDNVTAMVVQFKW